MALGLHKMGLLSQQLLTKSVAGSSNVALTEAEAKGGVLAFTGTLTGSIQVSVPAVLLIAGTFWVVHNGTSGAFTLTFIGATGTGVVVRQGCRAVIAFDGTNMVRVTPDVESDGDLSPAQIVDSNGNEVLKFTATASAVNELGVVNSATGNAVRLDASGNDSNISVEIRPKGSGTVIAQANVADANVIGGIPVLHRIDVPAGATGNVDVTLTHKTRIIDVHLVKRSAAGGGAGTIQVFNGASAITNAMSIDVVDQTVVRAGTIDDAAHEIAAAGTLRVTRTRTASTDETCVVYVQGVRVA